MNVMNEFQGILDNIPWMAVLIGIAIGFFVARKFPGLFPGLKPQTDNNTLAAQNSTLAEKLDGVVTKIDQAADKLAAKLEK